MQTVRLLCVTELKAAFLCCDVSLCLCRDVSNKEQSFWQNLHKAQLLPGLGATSQTLNAESESHSMRNFCVYVFLGRATFFFGGAKHSSSEEPFVTFQKNTQEQTRY